MVAFSSPKLQWFMRYNGFLVLQHIQRGQLFKGNLTSGASHTFEFTFSIMHMHDFYFALTKLDTILEAQLEPNFWICFCRIFGGTSKSKLSCWFLPHFQINLKTKHSPCSCIGPDELKIDMLYLEWTPLNNHTRFCP